MTATRHFSTWDYVVFGGLLCASSAIGIYYAIKATRNKSSADHYVRGHSMSATSVSLSLLAIAASPLTLLGTPTEMYVFGAQFWVVVFSYLITIPVTAFVFVPIYHNNKVTSCYEYLELRFNHILRTVCSVGSGIQTVVYTSIVLYGPALALQAVTGMDVWISVLSVGAACTFYTSLGGISAVVMADVFMSSVKYGSILLIAVKGTMDVGGIEEVFRKAMQSGRLHIDDFRADPTVRHSVWSLVFGSSVLWLTLYAVNQGWVQKYISMRDAQTTRRALWVNLVGIIALQTILSFVGLVIYAKYSDCDPLATKMISSADQLAPLHVMDTLGAIPGLSGFFVAGLFSGGLTSGAAAISSMATTTVEDIVKSYIKPDISDRAALVLMKILTILLGVTIVVMVYVSQQLGGIMQAGLTVLAIVGGPVFGVFCLGIFVPFANSTGAIVGLFSGVATVCWISIAAFIKKPMYPMPPVSVDGCLDLYFNVTGNLALPSTDILRHNSNIEYIYRISYFWYGPIGTILVLVVGTLVSLATGPTKLTAVDEKLLSPLCFRLAQKWRKNSEDKTHKGGDHKQAVTADPVAHGCVASANGGTMASSLRSYPEVLGVSL
ncbi:sodium-coupled monocarboxylate transporter 1-like isoform X2 [Ornithodoros turicata]|uniref:sodium-coupled monocarboxylate transporter 1-like isoform X2 n=1 Tax=Ornithodoros turicata TaxID=34597 RepID=UPI003139E168